MEEMVVIVRRSPEGWYVEDGSTSGPYFSRDRAVDLAEGMVAAVRSTGQPARMVLHEDS